MKYDNEQKDITIATMQERIDFLLKDRDYFRDNYNAVCMVSDSLKKENNQLKTDRENNQYILRQMIDTM